MNGSEIDDLLRRAASTGAGDDYDKFFSHLRGHELYFNITSGVDGEPPSTPLVQAGPGLSAVQFLTSKDNPTLQKNFGGIVWERALEMVVRMPQADGLIIQTNDATWVGLDRAKAQSLLVELPLHTG